MLASDLLSILRGESEGQLGLLLPAQLLKIEAMLKGLVIDGSTQLDHSRKNYIFVDCELQLKCRSLISIQRVTQEAAQQLEAVSVVIY